MYQSRYFNILPYTNSKKWCPHNNLVFEGNRDFPNENEEQNTYPYSVNEGGNQFSIHMEHMVIPKLANFQAPRSICVED